MKRNELDEMQLQKRNSIGNQSFMLLVNLLLIDICLNGLGVKWLAYPTNVFIIMLVCNAYYLIRIIWHNAYVGPGVKEKSTLLKIIYVAGLAALLAASIVLLTKKDLTNVPAADDNGLGSVLLFIISSAALIIAGIVGFIIRNKNCEK